MPSDGSIDTLSVYKMQLRNIGRAKCTVCPTNPTVSIPGPLTSLRRIPYRFWPLHVLCCSCCKAAN